MTRDAHKDQIEATGIAWQKQSPEYLVGYPDHVPAGKSTTPVIIEMQRRLITAIEDFDRKSGWLAGAMIALTLVIGVLAALQLWAVLQGGG